MSSEENRPTSSSIRSSVNDVLGLIAEYPRLALPVGVVVALFGLATAFKTLIDGFGWAYRVGQTAGVLVVVGAIALISLVAIRIVSAALAPRPRITPLPPHYLSRNPIIKWEYPDDNRRRTSYEIVVKRLRTGDAIPIRVPERMHQIAIPDITGPVEICVYTSIGGRRGRRSGIVRTEIYRDSVQRLRETGLLHVAVHTDPAEEIFCYLRTGRWQGLDIDFATLLASELQEDPDIARPIDVEYYFFEWPAIIGAPNNHEVDMAIASITISAERSKKYGIYFSVPYAESRLGVVAFSHVFAGMKPGDSITLDALKGKTVAIHKETIALACMEQAVQDPRYHDIGIQLAANNDELRELLRDNSVDAVVHDYYRGYTLLEAGMAVYTLDGLATARGDQYGIAFSRVNAPLLAKVDAILEKHRLRIRAGLARCIEERRRAIVEQETSTASEQLDRPAVSGPVNLFVYGTLMYEPVWRRLVAGEFERKAAHLSGYRRLRVKNEDYPGLVRGVGTVHGMLWLSVDARTLQSIDAFEATCYRRVSGVVHDDADTEIPADFFVIRDADLSVLEDAEWDAREFERNGLSRFLHGYAGFPHPDGVRTSS